MHTFWLSANAACHPRTITVLPRASLPTHVVHRTHADDVTVSRRQLSTDRMARVQLAGYRRWRPYDLEDGAADAYCEPEAANGDLPTDCRSPLHKASRIAEAQAVERCVPRRAFRTPFSHGRGVAERAAPMQRAPTRPVQWSEDTHGLAACDSGGEPPLPTTDAYDTPDVVLSQGSADSDDYRRFGLAHDACMPRLSVDGHRHRKRARCWSDRFLHEYTAVRCVAECHERRGCVPFYHSSPRHPAAARVGGGGDGAIIDDDLAMSVFTHLCAFYDRAAQPMSTTRPPRVIGSVAESLSGLSSSDSSELQQDESPPTASL